MEDWRLFIDALKTWRNIVFTACLFLCAASFSAFADPNDLWNLGPDGINAIAAWQTFGVDGNGVTIAIIDSGVNYNLPDLNQGYLGGYDYCSTGGGLNCNGEDADPMDIYGHGTQMASAMFGRGNSILGVSPKTKFYAIKVTDGNGYAWVTNLLQGLEWALSKEDVSIIYTGFYTSDNNAIYWLIINSYPKGIMFVAPSYIPLATLASHEKVIGVGGHTKDQNITSDTGNRADFLAPGEAVPVLDMNGNVVNAADMVGVAAAQAAGALALMVDYNNQHHKEYSNSAFWATLNQGAVPLNTGDPREGRGKLDVYNSLLLMANDWFIDCNCQFLNPNFQQNDLPGYFAGGQMNYNVRFTNNIPSNFTGNRDVNGYYGRSGLTITLSLRYDGHDNNTILDVNSIYEVNLPAGQSEQFTGSFPLDPNIAPGKIALYSKIVVHSQVDGDFSPIGIEAVIKRINCSYADILAPCGQLADFVADKIVDLRDFTVFASWWLVPCDESNGWCNGTDLVSEGIIDCEDLSEFASCWLCRYP